MKILSSLLRQTKDVTEDVQDQIGDFKTSEAGQTLTRLDARAGRWICMAKALLWFALGLVIVFFGYLGHWLTEGWIDVAIVAVSALAFLFVVWRGVMLIRDPQTASEVVLEEIEDRVWPASWTLGLFSSLFVRKQSRQG